MTAIASDSKTRSSGLNKREAFEEMVKRGIEPKTAAKLSGMSASYFSNHIKKTLVKQELNPADPYNPKNLVSKAHKILGRIIDGKMEAKPGELLTACKMVFDRSHPVNEPVAQASHQFIQINVQSLDKAVQAINAMPLSDLSSNAMQAVGSIDISSDVNPTIPAAVDATPQGQ